MGNKTVRRVGILLGIFVLLGGTSFALWRFQVERMAHNKSAEAEEATKKGDYAKAAELYREHLAVVPSDVEAQLKYADVLTNKDWAERKPEPALAIYESVVGQFPGREDVRRRAAEVATEMATEGIGGGLFERARGHLGILLKTAKDDGHLEYLMGRCFEEDKEYARAADYFGSAIAHGAPERIEAARRRATLLDQMGRTDKADQVIDAMVESAPDDFRVYLERGRYRNRPVTRRGPGRRPQGAGTGLRAGPGPARLRPGQWRRFPQGAGTGPRSARGLPGSRRRGRARVGTRRGPAGAGQGPGEGAAGRRTLHGHSPPLS